jgi:hypothetical protein
LYELTTGDEILTAVDSNKVTLAEFQQPLPSSTVTVYVPAAKPEVVVATTSPELQLYDHSPTPPVGAAIATPSVRPLQLTSTPL